MGKTLVAYFSAEGNTAKPAKTIADQIGADIFEIVPQTPYSKADIMWMNPLARCNKEKFGKKDVPVKDTVENFSEYDTVFIGFPIWYYAAPNIINTFVKAYDWTGKKVALFATSGGSGIGKTAEKLAPYMNGKGEIKDSKLFSSSESAEVLKKWAESV